MSVDADDQLDPVADLLARIAARTREVFGPFDCDRRLMLEAASMIRVLLSEVDEANRNGAWK